MAGANGYSGDPRQWMVHEFAMVPLAEGTTGILDGARSDPTRMAVGRQGGETLRCLVVELQTRPVWPTRRPGPGRMR